MPETNSPRLDTAHMEALLSEIDAIPDDHDGIDLAQPKLNAKITVTQALTSIRILRKLSA